MLDMPIGWLLAASVLVMGAIAAWGALERVHRVWIADQTERRFNRWHTKGDDPSEGDVV